MTQPLSDFLTEQEAADTIGVSTRTLRTYVESGRITRYRTIKGGTPYFKVDEILALVTPTPEIRG